MVAIFSGRMLRGESVTVNGDGLQTRDYVYVGDVARDRPCARAGLHGTAQFDCGRARAGWRPEVPLADGLRRTVEYFRTRQPGPAS